MIFTHNRGFRFPVRIVIAGLLILIQIGFVFGILYNLSAKSIWVYTVSELLGVSIVIYIVNSKGNASYKIAWVIFILLVPIFGVAVYLLWGGGRVLPNKKRKMAVCESHNLPVLEENIKVLDRLRGSDIVHARQADYLAGESGYPVYDRTSTEFFSPIEDFFPRFLEELERARKYIFIEFFILSEGDMWDAVHDILSRKVKDGVEIKIIFDDFGSISRQGREFLTKLRAEGIMVSPFNRIHPSVDIFMNNRNHRKNVIIDGEVAVTGGFNIGDEYINAINRFGYWMDCAVIVKGNAVKSFVTMFCNMWEFTTGQIINIRSHLVDCPVEASGFVLPYCDDPLNDRNPAEGIYMQILNTAQRYVYIATPYLIIDNMMITTLKNAAKAKIDVRIITPAIRDKWYVHPVTQYYYTELLEAGIKIYEYTPGFLHSKYFVSDDRVATVGTVNMDYRSFIFHFECGVWIADNNTVLDIRKDFEKLLSVSREIKYDQWKHRPRLLAVKQTLLHVLAPFM